MLLTVLRIALVPVFFVLVAIMRPPEIGWAGFVFAVAAASDWWDGHFARSMNLVSPLGAFLDPLADKLLTGAAFLAFAWIAIVPWWMVAVIVARDFFLTMFRIHADRIRAPLKTSYLAKVKTFAQMTFILLVLVAMIAEQGRLGISISSYAHLLFESGVMVWLMGFVTLLTFASAVMYGYDNWAVLRGARYWFRRANAIQSGGREIV